MSGTPWYLQTQNNICATSPISAGRSCFQAYLPPHRHDFIEIEFVASGTGTEIINGVEHKLFKGCITMLMPWHIHEIIPDEGQRIELVKCSFGSDLFVDNNAQFSELSDILLRDMSRSPVVYLKEPNCEKMAALLDEILEEYTDLRLWKDSLLKAKIAELLICIDRCRKNGLVSADVTSGGQNKFDIWKVVEYIHAAFNRNITLGETAAKFHYSGSHLNKIIKQNLGLSFDELLREIRVRNACAVMAYPMITVAEVSATVGYKSKESFYRAFKEIKGMSPENYRKLFYGSMGGSTKKVTAVLNAQIIYYLHLYYSEDISLSSLAHHFHYNESYLSDILMQSGFTFTSLLHEIRVYHACTMLLTSDVPVNEVAFQVGFDSAETFFRVFKKLKGITPGEYRKKKLTNDEEIIRHGNGEE